MLPAFFSFFLLLFLFPFLSPPSVKAQFSSLPSSLKWETIDQTEAQSRGIKISATVDGYLLDVEGWTSPYALVNLESTQGNVHASTMASLDGRFIFRHLLIPQVPGDFCFYSTDTQHLAALPLCLSPPPQTKVGTVSGIILAPTLEISQNQVLQGQEATLTGLTVPSSQVEAFLFEEEQSWFLEIINTLIPAAYARTGPHLVVQANEKGEFDFNLPTHKTTLWRLFLGSHTSLGLSPQSGTLEFRTFSWWQWLIYRFLQFLISAFTFTFKLLSHPTAIIFLEIPLAFYLIYLAFFKKDKTPLLSCLRYCLWPIPKNKRKKALT